MARDVVKRLRGWEGLLLVLLLVVVAANAVRSPGYLGVQNQINLLQLTSRRSSSSWP